MADHDQGAACGMTQEPLQQSRHKGMRGNGRTFAEGLMGKVVQSGRPNSVAGKEECQEAKHACISAYILGRQVKSWRPTW